MLTDTQTRRHRHIHVHGHEYSIVAVSLSLGPRLIISNKTDYNKRTVFYRLKIRGGFLRKNIVAVSFFVKTVIYTHILTIFSIN